MRKIWIVIANILIMLLIVLFVIIYTNLDHAKVYNNQVKMFESTAIRMNNITENYLKTEQDICDNWANYINSKSLDIDEALDFIVTSKKSLSASAHIIYKNTLTGLSSNPSIKDSSNYTISYSEIGLFNNTDWISDKYDSINVSRAYTNPIDAVQSMAFCRRVKINDNGTSIDAYLLRVIPVSIIIDKWALTQEGAENIELSLIDTEGNYIIHDTVYKNSNFFEFYKSYNSANEKELLELKNTINTGEGSFEMKNSLETKCIIAHTTVGTVGGWVLLSYIEASNLAVNNDNWMLVGIIAFGLIMLFIIDLIFMNHFYIKLKYLTKQADIANKAKTDFLSTMSHDIRTPMNAIVGLTTLTEKNINDTNLVKEYNRKIALASNHLLTLINDILDISKVESGKISLNPHTFSIVEVVENLVNLSHSVIREKKLDFRFHTSGIDYEYLYADKLRLNQIFINILSNAIKYTGNGGMISVDLIESSSDNEDYIKLTYIVSDTGIGMSKEFMEKMYSPFIRETDSRINRIEGTGLGLAITKKMVDLMGGTIECESEVEKGTKFTITLDIKKDNNPIADMRLDNINVLLIDDDIVSLNDDCDLINSLGAKCFTAKCGDEALELIKNDKIDIILYDIKINELSEIESLEKIRKELGNTPILITSVYDLSDIEALKKKELSLGFISKPLFKSSLYNKINEALSIDDGNSSPVDDYSDIANMNILIAEDNDINYEIIKEMLNMYHINAYRADDGEKCLNIIKKSKKDEYDLIFMDIQMPKMNGLDVTKNIRLLDNWAKNIPIIAMTADAFSENINECLSVGMNGHIAKPIDLSVVLKEIRRIKEEKTK